MEHESCDQDRDESWDHDSAVAGRAARMKIAPAHDDLADSSTDINSEETEKLGNGNRRNDQRTGDHSRAKAWMMFIISSSQGSWKSREIVRKKRLRTIPTGASTKTADSITRLLLCLDNVSREARMTTRLGSRPGWKVRDSQWTGTRLLYLPKTQAEMTRIRTPPSCLNKSVRSW